jgi:D-alanyl-D-alanine carboxypeptidase
MTSRRSKTMRTLGILFVLLALVRLGAVPAPRASDSALAAKIDAQLAPLFPTSAPGAAILIVRDGEVLFRRAYGTADLEQQIPLRPDHVFRIASVTKQFTAVAVLMLAERGLLSLADPLSRFLPDFPGAGGITIEHLLTHTSGVQDYTELPEWLPLKRKDLSLGELIGLFKDRPSQFAPGSRWEYSNSGYVLLGAVIEKASGQSYAEYLRQNIFTPLGMKDSCYGQARPIIPRRVPGYERTQSGFVNTPYLSMSLPYAAGAVLASVDDLARWQQGLEAGRLITASSLERAWTTARLADGTPTGYGYGWYLSTYAGQRVVEHGGGINGFAAYVLAAPDAHLFTAVLANTAGPPRALADLAFDVATLALGKPYQAPQPITLAEEQALAVLGTYRNGSGDTRTIRREGGRFYSQRDDGPAEEIYPVGSSEFRLSARTTTRILLSGDRRGEVTGLRFAPRVGLSEAWEKGAAPTALPKK